MEIKDIPEALQTNEAILKAKMKAPTADS